MTYALFAFIHAFCLHSVMHCLCSFHWLAPESGVCSHASTVVADTINADMPVCMLMHPIPMTMAVPSAAENEEINQHENWCSCCNAMKITCPHKAMQILLPCPVQNRLPPHQMLLLFCSTRRQIQLYATMGSQQMQHSLYNFTHLWDTHYEREHSSKSDLLVPGRAGLQPATVPAAAPAPSPEKKQQI